jgi:divalent metal cation (Fe/Co/Zn/Cd) transporter
LGCTLSEAKGVSNLPVSADTVFQVVVEEARALYKLIVTVASTFLGATLLFMEKIAPKPEPMSLIVLGLGWASLIGSILAVLRVHLLNLRSGTNVVQRRNDLAAPIDKKNEKLTGAASIMLAIGLLAIAVFGLWNLAAPKH